MRSTYDLKSGKARAESLGFLQPSQQPRAELEKEMKVFELRCCSAEFLNGRGIGQLCQTSRLPVASRHHLMRPDRRHSVAVVAATAIHQTRVRNDDDCSHHARSPATQQIEGVTGRRAPLTGAPDGIYCRVGGRRYWPNTYRLSVTDAAQQRHTPLRLCPQNIRSSLMQAIKCTKSKIIADTTITLSASQNVSMSYESYVLRI